MAKDKGIEDRAPQRHGELPLTMIIPIVVCFVAILLLGIFNVKIVDILLLTVKGVAL